MIDLLLTKLAFSTVGTTLITIFLDKAMKIENIHFIQHLKIEFNLYQSTRYLSCEIINS